MALASIDLELGELLADPKRANAFFQSITQDEIASQIIALRKERDLTQSSLASLINMKQSAVSRIEKAEYASWNLKTLFRVAAALQARWKIILQPVEEAIEELSPAKRVEKEVVQGAAVKAAVATQQKISAPNEASRLPARWADFNDQAAIQ